MNHVLKCKHCNMWNENCKHHENWEKSMGTLDWTFNGVNVLYYSACERHRWVGLSHFFTNCQEYYAQLTLQTNVCVCFFSKKKWFVYKFCRSGRKICRVNKALTCKVKMLLGRLLSSSAHPVSPPKSTALYVEKVHELKTSINRSEFPTMK